VTGAGPETSRWLARWDDALMANYGTPSVVLASGSGATVVDVDGKQYVDLLGGIAVNLLGHAHPAVVEAVSQQIRTLGHTSNLAAHAPGIELAERLKDLIGSGPDCRVLFTNSGAEANEAALKLSRRLRPGGGWVACEGAFHGRTMGALAVTGQSAKRIPFEPLPGPVVFVPYGDAEALAAAVDETTASVVLEPVMGEAGVVLPPAGFLEAARQACDRSGALLHLDEVQGGVGRVGSWLTSRVVAPTVVPDVVTLAKALGGGLPIGAVVANGRAASAFGKGDHGTTFGGSPIACAAALAVLRTVEQDGLLDRAQSLGEHLRDGIEALQHPLVQQVRGLGLWIGIVLTGPVSVAVEAAAQEAGFLVNAAAPAVIRLAPPLVVTRAQIDAFLAALPAILSSTRVQAMQASAVASPA
jgi:acetylornithine/N-succinyldiaminopimelate aminotransferase